MGDRSKSKGLEEDPEISKAAHQKLTQPVLELSGLTIKEFSALGLH